MLTWEVTPQEGLWFLSDVSAAPKCQYTEHDHVDQHSDG